MVLSEVQPGIRKELERVLAQDRYARAHGQRGKQAGDPQTIKRLLTAPRMRMVWRHFRVSHFTDDQVSRFLAAAVVLAFPAKQHCPVFTLRQIQRAEPRERAVMEWHVAAPGSPNPAVANYLALLADTAKQIFGTAGYRTVATVAGVVLNTGTETTDKVVRSAVHIFTKPSAKVKIWRVPAA